MRASKEYFATSKGYFDDLEAVRIKVTSAEQIALSQVSVAQQQLDQLKLSVAGILDVHKAVLTVAQILATMSAGKTIQEQVAGLAAKGSTAAANDNFNAAAYLAANKDIAKYAAANGLDPAAFALQHYLGTGQYAIAAGFRVRGFASGGYHPGGLRIVGAHGPEIEATGPARYWSAPQTAQMLSGGADPEMHRKMDALLVEVRALVAQNGAVGQATIERLTDAVEALGSVKRQVRASAA